MLLGKKKGARHDACGRPLYFGASTKNEWRHASLFVLHEDRVAIGGANVFSSVRGCNNPRDSSPGFVADISRRAVWIVKTQRAISEGVGDKWNRM
jgi:hypothetical protein